MKKFLSLLIVLSLVISLVSLPVMADSNDVAVSITPNYDIFRSIGDSYSGAVADLFYNGAAGCIVDDTITYNAVKFNLVSGGMAGGANDSVQISADTDVTLNGEIYKSITILGAGVSADSTFDAEVTYSDDSVQLVEDASLASLKISGGQDMGFALKRRNAMSTVLAESTTNVYLHSYTINLTSTLGVSKLTLKAGTNPYFISAVTATKYSGDDLDALNNMVIGQHFGTYESKVITEIADTDIANLEALYGALMASTTNANATPENCTRIYNLKEGAKLYLAKKALYDEINTIYAAKDYRTAEVEELTPADKSNLEALVEKYTAAEALDITALAEYMAYFNDTDVCIIDLTEKAVIEELKAEYERKVYVDTLTGEIDTLYAQYEAKTSGEINAGDITNLETLISKYNEAEANNVPYSAENKAKIESLLRQYNAYQNSEKTVHYDLTPYFTTSVIGSEGETATKFGFGDEAGSVGFSKTYVESKLTNGLLSGTFTFNKYVSGSTHNPALESVARATSFKIGDDRTASGKNAISSTKTIITGSKRLSSYLYVLYAVGSYDTSARIDIDYTDGTSYAQITFRLPWTGQRGEVGLYQSNKLRLNSGVLEKFTGNKPVIAGRGAAIPIEEGKIIDSITLSGGTAVLAVSEEPLTNAKVRELATAQYLLVDDEEITNGNIADVKKMVLYANELETRGIDITEIGATASRINELRNYVLTINASTYRANETAVEAVLDFSVPVSETQLTENLSIRKNTVVTNDYDVAMSNGDKRATITIPETRNGGNAYSITVAGALPLKNYGNITLGSDYIVNYTVPDYFTYTYDNSSFNVTNNSVATESVNAIATVVGADGKTVYAAAEADGNLSADLTASAALGTVKTVLWNSNMKTISKDTDIPSCTAAEIAGSNFEEPVFDLASNTLSVKGYTPSAAEGRIVNIKIKDTTANPDKVVYANSIKTGRHGFFAYEIIFPSDVYATSFDMEISLGGDDFAVPNTTDSSVYYSSKTDRENLIDSMTTMTEAQILQNIDNIKRTLCINFAPADAISDAGYAKAIYNCRAELNKSNLSGTQEALKVAAIVTAFNEDKDAVLFGADGKLLYNDVMNYSGTIDAGGVTLYSIMNTDISDEGRAAIKQAMLSGSYADKAAVITRLKEEIFVRAFNNPISGGTGYITNLLTSANAAAVNANITNFTNNSSSVAFRDALALQRGQLVTRSAIESYISTYSVPAAVVPETPVTGSTSGLGSGGGGGGVSIGNNAPAVNNPVGAPTPISPNKPSTGLFNDVPDSFWAYEYIRNLVNKGILSGKGNGLFAPEAALTRGELVKILCVAYGLKYDGSETPFTDLEGKWYADYAKAAYVNGLVNGISETEFGGDLPVSRQDICTILFRMKQAEAEADLSFADNHTISEYAESAVTYMVKNGIVNGFEDNTFRGPDNCSRAQVAKIIDMFLNMQ